MGDRIRVLHVDDDPDLADITALFLEREDPRITVETVSNATEGLERLDDLDLDANVDCIVSDHDMPGPNGIEFLEAVRERDPDLPFILYTGRGSESVASEAISAGVTDYLQKGGGTEQYEILANRIVDAAEKRRIEREPTGHRPTCGRSPITRWTPSSPSTATAEFGSRTRPSSGCSATRPRRSKASRWQR